MKKLLFILLAILVFAGICMVTRPEKKRHTKAIIEVMIKNSKVDLNNNTKVKSVIENSINSLIDIKDYYVLNIGVMQSNDKEKRLTLGILGNVFILDDNNGFKSKVKK